MGNEADNTGNQMIASEEISISGSVWWLFNK